MQLRKVFRWNQYLLSFSLLLPLVGHAGSKPLTIAIIQEWSQFNPVNNQLASTKALLNFMVRSMIQRDASGTVLPDLAEDIPSLKNKKATIVTKNGVRKVVATWTIKAKAKWGDGHDLTCADWWQGWQAGLNPHVTVDEKQIYKKIENIEWKDDAKKVCKVTYSNDDWTFDRDLPEILPQHLEQPIFEKWKDKNEGYDRASTYIKEPTNPGLYSGPYVVSEFKLGSHFILKINPHFYGQKPSIEKIIVKHIGDTSALRVQLMTGAVDIISGNGFPSDMALALSEEAKKAETTFTVKFQDSPMFQGLFFNTEHEILKDPKVRKALNLAVNKKDLTQAFFQGKIIPAESIYALQSPAYEKETPSYNPALARKTLEEAGWKLNDKKIYSKNGKDLKLEFMTSAGIKTNETLQVYICDNFLQIGVQCLIKNQSPRVFLGNTIPHGEYTIAMYGLPITPDASLSGVFSSGEIPKETNGWAGGNSTRWKSPEADRLLLALNKEWDFKKRTQILRALGKEITKEVPMAPIYHRREALVFPKKLKGLSEDISGIYFMFPEKWHF